MQKIKIICFAILIICIPNVSFSTNEEILKSQSETLNIKGFVEEANQYTKDVFSGIDVNELMDNAIKGQIDNKTLIHKILNLFGSEIVKTLQIIRKHFSCYCDS